MLTHNETLTENREPRSGIAPFATGTGERTEDSSSMMVKSKEFQLGHFGKAILILQHGGRGEELVNEIEGNQAFTIDLSGKIDRGNLRDFVRNGYYQIMAMVTPPEGIKPIQDGQLNINLWIDGTEPTVSAWLENGESYSLAFFDAYDSKKHIMESFVLSLDPKILEAIRINVATDRGGES